MENNIYLHAVGGFIIAGHELYILVISVLYSEFDYTGHPGRHTLNKHNSSQFNNNLNCDNDNEDDKIIHKYSVPVHSQFGSPSTIPFPIRIWDCLS